MILSASSIGKCSELSGNRKPKKFFLLSYREKAPGNRSDIEIGSNLFDIPPQFFCAASLPSTRVRLSEKR